MSNTFPARITGLAVRPSKGALPQERESLTLDPQTCVDGDHARRPGRRMVTLLRAEDWAAAIAEVPAAADLPWFRRRANLLAEGLPSLENRTGWSLKMGDGIVLEITGECDPCEVMDAQAQGLRAALDAQWRGGVTCRIRRGGSVTLGDPVHLVLEMADTGGGTQ